VEGIGIIGVGALGSALVAGLCSEADAAGGGGTAPEVFLSPRGARTAAELAARHARVHVCGSNQEVVDRAELVIVAVRPADRHDALAGLRVHDDRVLVNVMAGVGNDEVRRLLGTSAPVVRAIPLPTVSERRCVTVTYPEHPAVSALFAELGGVLPVADEAAFDVFSALTATISTHYAYLATLASWAAAQGIAPAAADRYVRDLFQGVGRSLADTSHSLDQLAAAHETPGGSNARVRTTWFTPAAASALTDTLDTLLSHLTARPAPPAGPSARPGA
jgi:pyrroline-5-carboxylate reductase